VFKKPSDNETDYIKRLIGLPGDRIQVVGGVLQINGEPVLREKISQATDRDAFSSRTFDVYRETLPNGRQHLIWEASDNDHLDNTNVYVVPEGSFFFMGDNRDNSRDSRVLYDVGYVPLENLVGRAEFLFFSHNDSASWWQVWRWPWVIRFGRIFSGIN
jgi:signal peptidase I